MVKLTFLLMLFAVNLNASDENLKFLKDKLFSTARAEYNFFKSSLVLDKKIECENLYLEILDYVNKLTDEEKKKNNKFYSRVYDRIGWFMFNNSEKLNEKQLSDIFTLSLNLYDKNYIAYFKAYEFYSSRNIKLSREYLLRAFELKPTSPELLLAISSYYSDEKQKLLKLFIENRKNYLPEIHYFGVCYPHENLGVAMNDDNGKQFEVERYIKFKASDETRFQLIELE
jgi:hypothetical protein